MVKLMPREAFMFFTMQTQTTLLKTKTTESTKKRARWFSKVQMKKNYVANLNNSI